MTRPPDFDELVGGDVSPEERARLRRAHDLLVAAGPPAELTPALEQPVSEPLEPVAGGLPRRRIGALLSLAAALALVAFLGGFLAGYTRHGFDTTLKVRMHGTTAARGASALIRVGKLDSGGNWPLKLQVRGLEPLPEGGYYEMFLTRGRHPAANCGTFRIRRGEVTVRLNAPYSFKRYDGWVVTKQVPGGAEPGVVVLTT